MKTLFKYIILCFFVSNSWIVSAQGHFNLNKTKSQKISFELVSNLIIIPVEINGVTLSFVLDTGVSKPILFNLTESDSLNLKNAETFYLHGLGADGKIEALRSRHNIFKIGDALNVNQDLYVVFDETINFTPRMGVLIHGIIGYDVFKDFVVEINYNSKYIRLHRPTEFKQKSSKKWKTIPINIYKNKPYVNAKIAIDKSTKPVKLLIDTGSSDALWVFEDLEKDLAPIKDFYFIDFLGKGLSGSVYGKRSKIKNFELNGFQLKNVNVAFPDSLSIDVARVYKERNGSLGGEILKRFNVFVDYKNKALHLKKNNFFRNPFTYNNSGIILEHNGTMFVKEQIKLPSNNNRSKNNFDAVQVNYSIDYRLFLKPVYKIVEIRKSSNAYIKGLRIDDVLTNINGKMAYDYELSEINSIFHGATGKTIRLKIVRNGVDMLFKFKLDNAFKK